jgi:hypothetical protein
MKNKVRTTTLNPDLFVFSKRQFRRNLRARVTLNIELNLNSLSTIKAVLTIVLSTCASPREEPCQNRSSASPCMSKVATKWGGLSDETGKTEVLCHSRCGTIKIPLCSKALSAEHRPKFCSPSPAVVTSPYK